MRYWYVTMSSEKSNLLVFKKWEIKGRQELSEKTNIEDKSRESGRL